MAGLEKPAAKNSTKLAKYRKYRFGASANSAQLAVKIANEITTTFLFPKESAAKPPAKYPIVAAAELSEIIMPNASIVAVSTLPTNSLVKKARDVGIRLVENVNRKFTAHKARKTLDR